jgi:D-glycero-D-manno-heptose 1,7-bisphosphate phosphatase
LKSAVFLDRDGVLNQDPPHYAHRLDQLELIPRSADAVRILKQNNFTLIVVSNQSGIARGYYTENDADVFNNALIMKLREAGGDIEGVYYCPHHPDAIIEKYKITCDCRKPRAGMILRAAQEHNIDLSTSYFIGDKISDMEAGKAAGCHPILVLTGHGRDEVVNYDDTCLVADDLYDAVSKYILCKK